MLPLNNPVTTTVTTVNKLTTVNTLLIIVDSRTPHASITANVMYKINNNTMKIHIAVFVFCFKTIFYLRDNNITRLNDKTSG